MDLKEIIGKRIRAEREKRGFSQGKLAEALGWNNHQTVIGVESGQREVKAWELARIAKFLGVDLGALLSEPETNKPLPYVLWRDKTVVKEPEIIESKFRKRCSDYAYVEQVLELNQEKAGCIPSIEVDLEKTDFQRIYRMAKDARDKLSLGNYPAQSIVKTLEENCGVKFFCEDLVGLGSAATSRGKTTAARS